MKKTLIALTLVMCGSLTLTGCGPVDVDFATIQKPAPAADLAPLGRFVGDWTLEAERSSGDGNTEKWTGTATWKWVLGEQYLRGDLTMSGPIEFNAVGFWGWHSVKKGFIWSLINDWGCPQMGRATYNPDQKMWVMTYYGVGLDGTNSWGKYVLQWVDDNNLTWEYHEWADSMKMVKKLEMKGAYKRK